MIKHVVFDVGKVLVDFDWQGFFTALAMPPEVEERVAQATVRSEMWNEFDRGRLTDEEIRKGFLEKAPECEEQIMQFWNNVGSCIKRYEYALPWIQSLREKGYQVYLLSNYPRRIYSQSIEELAFVEEVDGAIFSYEVQAIKPEPEIYQALLEKYQLNPTECVFLDDRRENLVTANQLGMATIHFHTKSQAEEELRSLGVE